MDSTNISAHVHFALYTKKTTQMGAFFRMWREVIISAWYEPKINLSIFHYKPVFSRLKKIVKDCDVKIVDKHGSFWIIVDTMHEKNELMLWSGLYSFYLPRILYEKKLPYGYFFSSVEETDHECVDLVTKANRLF